MLNIFHKIQIKSILDQKVKDREIISYKLEDKSLFIHVANKRKNKKYNVSLDKLSGKELISILWKPIPKDIENHFKIEIRNIKLRNLLN